MIGFIFEILFNNVFPSNYCPQLATSNWVGYFSSPEAQIYKNKTRKTENLLVSKPCC